MMGRARIPTTAEYVTASSMYSSRVLNWVTNPAELLKVFGSLQCTQVSGAVQIYCLYCYSSRYFSWARPLSGPPKPGRIDWRWQNLAAAPSCISYRAEMHGRCSNAAGKRSAAVPFSHSPIVFSCCSRWQNISLGSMKLWFKIQKLGASDCEIRIQWP